MQNSCFIIHGMISTLLNPFLSRKFEIDSKEIICGYISDLCMSHNIACQRVACQDTVTMHNNIYAENSCNSPEAKTPKLGFRTMIGSEKV